jgi:hypothetical protein
MSLKCQVLFDLCMTAIEATTASRATPASLNSSRSRADILPRSGARVRLQQGTPRPSRQSGHFLRVRQGLYRFREYPSSPREDVIAAWLATRREVAVVSHQSALDILGLSDVVPEVVDLTVPRAKRYRSASRGGGNPHDYAVPRENPTSGSAMESGWPRPCARLSMRPGQEPPGAGNGSSRPGTRPGHSN